MSLCKLHSIHLLGSRRPLIWTCIPRAKFTVITKASGGRSTTRKERNQSSRPEDDSDGVNSLWDSNVESVRWRNRNRSDASRESSTSTPDWLTPKKEWTFNPQGTGEDPNEVGEEERETKSEEEELPWWRFSSKANYDYDDGETEVEDTDYDDEEDDEEDDDGFDMKSIFQEQVLSSLRWGIPISFVVLPWLLGNPVIILVGLALVPAVQKLVGPAVKELWRAFLNLSGSPAPKRRRKAGNYDFDEREEDAYSSWGGERDKPPKPFRYKRTASSYDSSPAEPLPYADVGSNGNRSVSRQDRNEQDQVSMGGWEDLEADRRGMMPVRRPRRSSKLGWKRRKKEKPLIVRLLVALFPFLRNWGGWLSVFMVFPFLGVVEGNYFR